MLFFITRGCYLYINLEDTLDNISMVEVDNFQKNIIPMTMMIRVYIPEQ